MRSLGSEGEGPGEFQRPWSMFNYTDSLVVWHYRARRVSIFAPTGEFSRSFSLPGYVRPEAVVGLVGDALVAAKGRIALPPPGSDVRRDSLAFTLVNLQGDSIAALPPVLGDEQIASTASGGLVVIPLVLGRITHVAAGGADVFVGTNDGYGVDLYRNAVLIRSIRRDVPPVVPSEALVTAEKERRMAGMTDQIRALVGPAYAAMPRVAALPLYRALHRDASGHLWVRNFTTRADRTERWSVFDPDGRRLGDVTMPSGLTVYEIGSNYVLGRVRDALDIEYVHLHTLTRGES